MDFEPMSPEEMQRMMQFLLKQQAQFEANFARSQENFARSQENLARSQENLAKGQERFDSEMQRLSAKTDRMTEGLIGLTAIVGQLASAQIRTDEVVRQTAAHVDRVEAHLNAVVEMFERHLREDHGQRPS